MSSAWPTAFSMIGPSGATGATGGSGVSIYNGTEVPSNTGVEGDYFIHNQSRDIYTYSTGTWNDLFSPEAYFSTVRTHGLVFSPSVFQSTITTSTVSTYTSTFTYTGAAETFAIPEGVTQITFDVLGAGGANLGGGGAYVSGTYTVQSGDVGFSVYVGQGGQLTGNSLGAQLVGTSFLLDQSGGSAALTTDPTSVGGGGGGASGILFPDGSKIVAGAGAGGYVYGSTLHRGGAGGLTYGSEPQQTNEA
jgi:hypothetical protein